MTQSLELLARRTASMQGIRSIVHTMKTLSVINAAPYEHAARDIGAYHDTVVMGLHAFLSQVGPLEPNQQAVTTTVLIAFGSDHGLCGNYNEVLARFVVEQRDNTAAPFTVLCIGAQMADALKDQGIMIDTTFFPPASVDGIGRLANLLTQHLDELRGKTAAGDMAVSLAYFMREGDNGQKPTLTALLPLDRALLQDLQTRPWVSRSLPTFSMPPTSLFQALVKGHLFASLFRAAAEALVTENAARLALMQKAEQSVDDRLESLIAQTRSVRQSEITTELLDVIIGFEALKKNRERAAVHRPPVTLRQTSKPEP
ncbi:F0F1 ATP synthase subunit gamma [Yoonia sediminilitoris]|uniref:F-type H+-transporting ATPase subunit gamma n=1 Tax=Yoonia sediminilitoris TaxID=1286148 RepID=A0A2T6KJP7_9RHOB|nr:FoF1 ATP synthase subunit gamma [Yoonia sediminilitoris]PUB16187.1 F-type H+-transporting ATPase subunit gamma [Yoonia sediminilitoris]RCW96536.1 F-type H+-transporting ATPase subunit gamma [Yoonia sediminilitoris]